MAIAWVSSATKFMPVEILASPSCWHTSIWKAVSIQVHATLSNGPHRQVSWKFFLHTVKFFLCMAKFFLYTVIYFLCTAKFFVCFFFSCMAKFFSCTVKFKISNLGKLPVQCCHCPLIVSRFPTRHSPAEYEEDDLSNYSTETARKKYNEYHANFHTIIMYRSLVLHFSWYILVLLF